MPERFSSHEEWAHHNPIGDALLYKLPAWIGRRTTRKEPAMTPNNEWDNWAALGRPPIPASSSEPAMTVDRAFHWLYRLVSWGHGDNAPDMAKRDWTEAREFLRREGKQARAVNEALTTADSRYGATTAAYQRGLEDAQDELNGDLERLRTYRDEDSEYGRMNQREALAFAAAFIERIARIAEEV